MRAGPPNLPGAALYVETPIDRALSLALAHERDAALRWAAAIVKLDPAMPSALCVSGRLLGEMGRQETAREALKLAVQRSIEFENLSLAVASAREFERFGGDPGPLLDRIAESFCKGSERLGSGAPPPPPLPSLEAFQPLASALSGAALVNKATEIIHEARKKFETETHEHGISPLPLFSAIGREGLRGLCEAFAPKWVAQGDTVIRQGETGSEAYFVARGELEVRRTREAETLVLARLSNGAIFGEMALLCRAPRTGSVVAVRPSIVLEARRDVLDALADKQPEVGVELAAHCRARLLQNLVKTSELLRVVPSADRPALFDRFETRTFEKNERLIVERAVPPGLYLIASGEVAVVRQDQGDPLIISTLGPGDVVGEVATVLRRRANANVIALHPTVTLFLKSQDFMEVIKEHPAVLLELYFLAIKRDEETQNILEQETSVAEDFVLL